MNYKTKKWLVALGLSFGCYFASSQSTGPRWLSNKGYWVVEGNVHAPLDHIVRFYNNEDMLIYKEVLKGVKMNPERRKVKLKLKKALETAITAWEMNKKPDSNYVSLSLK